MPFMDINRMKCLKRRKLKIIHFQRGIGIAPVLNSNNAEEKVINSLYSYIFSLVNAYALCVQVLVPRPAR